MENPVRVLLAVGKMFNGGVESFNMGYFRNIDPKIVKCDFAVNRDSTFPQREEIKRLGGKVYIVSSYKNPVAYISDIFHIIKNNHYDIVNAQMNTMNFLPLFAAWLGGVKVRICFNHSTAHWAEGKIAILKYILRPIACLWATEYFACEKYSAAWMFGKKRQEADKLTIVPAFIDFEKFRFRREIRDMLREKMGVSDKKVIGHIGRFVLQKNHEFLIDIFESVHKIDQNTVLLLVGNGPLREKVKKRVKDLRLEEAVIFVDPTNEVEKYYWSMDSFCLPSYFEGISAVSLEAQATQLPVIVSKAVSPEADLTEYITYLSLQKTCEMWAEAVLGSMSQSRERDGDISRVIQEKFDVRKNALELQEKYVKLFSS